MPSFMGTKPALHRRHTVPSFIGTMPALDRRHTVPSFKGNISVLRGNEQYQGNGDLRFERLSRYHFAKEMANDPNLNSLEDRKLICHPMIPSIGFPECTTEVVSVQTFG